MKKKVILYSSNVCPYCNMAIEYFKEKNIQYEERNIQEDGAARRELMKMDHLGVPVILVDGEEIVGFDQEKLDQLIGD